MRVFPLRAAAIDVGSNAMRLIVAEFTGTTAYVSLAEQRLPVRLGASVFSADGGPLDEALMDSAVAGLAGFRQRMDELSVQVYRASATSAVREASNGTELVQRVWREAGIRLDTITGGEEARLVWLAVSSRLELSGGQWIFVDLGGGSVEIGRAEDSSVLWSESHAMGSVRLLSELGGARRTPNRFRRLATEYIDTLVSRISVETGNIEGVIATGGNIEELARMSRAPSDEKGAARLSLKALDSTIDRIASMSTQERIDELGLRPDRADVILPAALVYERVARLARADEIIVPFVGLKEGLLLDAMLSVAQHRDHLDRQQREVVTGAIALGRRYLFDEAHAHQVTRLALSLFDQLHERMELSDGDRLILLAAAMLHDVGQYISYRRHHKHSYYLIANASLPDINPHDTLLVALVARYHRRAEPGPDHEGFAELDDDEQTRVTKLAALLRIADALDRQHRQHVQEVRAKLSRSTLRLDVSTNGDLMLEEWAIEKKAQLITRVLDVELDIRIRTGD
ncbi:Ppx/GppA phosphatase family protein [soil metagenome]